MRLFIFYEADVAVPAAAAVPKDEAALCHVSPVPSAVMTHAIAHGGWTMVRGVDVDICNRNIARQHERYHAGQQQMEQERHDKDQLHP